MRTLPRLAAGMLLLAASLAGCGAGIPGRSSHDDRASHPAVQAFADALTPRMESLLSSRTGQRSVYFEIDFAEIGGAVVLSVPDYIERTTVFDLQVEGTALTGQVLTDEERTAVVATAASTMPGVSCEVRVWEGHTYGIVLPSVSDLLDAPDGDLATQARSGERVSLLERSADGRFVRVLMESDGYLAWAPASDVAPMGPGEWLAWGTAASATLQERVGDLVAGTRLPQLGVGLLELPLGGQVQVPESTLQPLGSTAQAVLSTAYELLPGGSQPAGSYLWGGTAGDRLDCSGFTQSVFRLCGYSLPRDADQQQESLPVVAPTLDRLGELAPGDFLFFSENRQYATHVGLWIGDGRIVHCSTGGDYPGVKISSMVGDGEYDRFLRSIYFGGGRGPAPQG